MGFLVTTQAHEGIETNRDEAISRWKSITTHRIPGARPCVQQRACNPTGGNPVK